MIDIEQIIQNKRILLLTIIVLLLVAFILQAYLDNESKASNLSNPESTISTSQAIFNFLGGVRETAAAFLWIKIDDDFHNYIGNQGNEQELMPLFRIIAWLDPKFEDAYYVGSYLLFIYKRPEQGLAFAKEGISYNPRSAKLHFNLGQIYLFYIKDYPNAIKHFRQAVDLTKNNNEKAEYLVYLISAYNKADMPEEAEKTKVFQQDLKDKGYISPNEITAERDHKH